MPPYCGYAGEIIEEVIVNVTVVIKGGCCQDVSVVDNKGNPVKFELTIDDKD